MSFFQTTNRRGAMAGAAILCAIAATRCLAASSANFAPGLNVPYARPLSDAIAGLPLFFETNRDSVGNEQFLARGQNYQFLISRNQALLILRHVGDISPIAPLDRQQLMSPRPYSTRTVKLSFVGSSSDAQSFAQDQISARINYLIGNEPSVWRTSLPAFQRVKVHNLYPGVDIVYYGNQRRLVYDFAIHPHIHPTT